MVGSVSGPSILLLLPTLLVTSASAGFIDNAPAPSPEDGPPLSAHASRNKALLPAQICGILGAYILTVLFWGVLLLTVGRKMRRKTLETPSTLELQTVKGDPKIGITPISPASSRSAASWFKRPFKKSSAPNSPSPQSPTSPAVHSIASFDQSIVDMDKEMRQKEMERLYAAVMDHDAKKASLISSSEEDISPVSPEQQHAQQAALLPGPKKPPMLDMKSAEMPRRGSHTNPASPASPKSPAHAIYPPGYHNPPPTAPLPRSGNPPASPRSILTKKSRTSSIGSASSKTRLGLRGLRISAPLQKYPGEPLHDEARTPLSPRFYNPPAPPSPPQDLTPTSPEGDYNYEVLDTVQPLPRPAPQRSGSSYSNPPAVGSATKSAASSTNTLPLRAMNDSASSLSSTKTTYVDRRRDNLSLQTPRTGVPQTPYSPYMPFTPITPVTPHLVSKYERKAMKKASGKKAATADDAVQSPKEIFGDGW